MTTHTDDNYLLFVQLFARHEAGLRTFVRSLLPTWTDTDEVMQEVSIVLWKKFDQFDPSTEFIRWAAVIARYEVLHYRRSKARDRHVLSEDVMELLAKEAVETVAAPSDRRAALEKCLAKVPEARRTLLLQAYRANATIKDVAEQAGTTPTALYKTLARLRANLYTCIRANLRSGELA
jgi:RNA polymerase sigma-70 factor (ECF subfamily)